MQVFRFTLLYHFSCSSLIAAFACCFTGRYIDRKFAIVKMADFPYICFNHRLGRCLQHRGGEPERAKGADGMQLFALDCIAYIVDAETN